jgi:hypothetical protein
MGDVSWLFDSNGQYHNNSRRPLTINYRESTMVSLDLFLMYQGHLQQNSFIGMMVIMIFL